MTRPDLTIRPVRWINAIALLSSMVRPTILLCCQHASDPCPVRAFRRGGFSQLRWLVTPASRTLAGSPVASRLAGPSA